MVFRVEWSLGLYSGLYVSPYDGFQRGMVSGSLQRPSEGLSLVFPVVFREGGSRVCTASETGVASGSLQWSSECV